MINRIENSIFSACTYFDLGDQFFIYSYILFVDLNDCYVYEKEDGKISREEILDKGTLKNYRRVNDFIEINFEGYGILVGEMNNENEIIFYLDEWWPFNPRKYQKYLNAS